VKQPEDGIRDALRDLTNLSHLAITLLEQREKNGTATDEELAVVRTYRRALAAMRAERLSYDNHLDEHDGIVSALHTLERR
jgi:hypothetical protein